MCPPASVTLALSADLGRRHRHALSRAFHQPRDPVEAGLHGEQLTELMDDEQAP